MSAADANAASVWDPELKEELEGKCVVGEHVTLQ